MSGFVIQFGMNGSAVYTRCNDWNGVVFVLKSFMLDRFDPDPAVEQLFDDNKIAEAVLMWNSQSASQISIKEVWNE